MGKIAHRAERGNAHARGRQSGQGAGDPAVEGRLPQTAEQSDEMKLLLRHDRSSKKAATGAASL